MATTLFAVHKTLLSSVLFLGNTLLWCLPIYLFAILKFLIPQKHVRRFCSRIMVYFAEAWISINALNLKLTQNIRWEIRGLSHLRKNGTYLICSNHQSWVDIIVLQTVLNRRIPFLRFFLKQELLYVPFLGLAWWALDFPFMKRHSREYLEKHPHKRGDDIAATKRACERLRGVPVSILNFLEGTRFTEAKHREQNSPFQNLLKPKAGGLSFVLEAMGDQFDSLLDVTIVYPKGAVTFFEMLSGKLEQVIVDIRRLEIPKNFLNSNFQNDEDARLQLQEWIKDIWTNKDLLINELNGSTKITKPSLTY